MIVGLLGYAQVGKDTACQLLDGYRVAFADALKGDLEEIIENRYGLNPDLLTPELKEILRPLYVAHGAVGRAIDPTLWIRAVVSELYRTEAEANRLGKLLCITDVRYRNEASVLIGRAARLIYISRPGHRAANEEEERSFAEIFADRHLWRQVQQVDNDGTKSQFKRRLRAVLGLRRAE